MKRLFIPLLVVVCSLFIVNAPISAMDSLKVGSSTREMIVYTPKDLPKNSPLIISMHGMNQDAPYQQSKALWEPIADTAKFVVVYPNGIGKRWDISGSTDIDFILAIIDDMSSRYGINRNRVYLSGFSMGGMMTYYAASKIANKIAAFAPVSGYMLRGGNFTSSRPVPIIHTHGDADDVVNYGNLATYLNGWITRNNCLTTPVITKPYPANKPNSVATKSYWGKGPNGEVEVVLMTLSGKGHWYSMDVANGISTSIEIWNFVKRYSL